MHAADGVGPKSPVRWCVFCGSAPGKDPLYLQTATATGTMLARRGIDVVYGGGNVGLMGAVADAALAAGGNVIGVIPHSLAAREVAHAAITRLHVVESMHERKALMNELSNGFVMLPGGFGTFEEFCEVVTWVQLRIIDKPCIVLNAGGYYDPLLAMFARAHAAGFISDRNRSIIEVVDSVDALAAEIGAPKRCFRSNAGQRLGEFVERSASPPLHLNEADVSSADAPSANAWSASVSSADAPSADAWSASASSANASKLDSSTIAERNPAE